MADFEKRSVIVTGAASGIGRATALAFAERGAQVIVADIDESGAHACTEEIIAQDGRALAVVCDVTSEASVRQMVEFAVRHHHGINILVSNAGILMIKSAAQATAEDWARSFATNISAAALCARYAGEVMRASGGGTMVMVASISGMRAEQGFATYSSSKAALLMLTRSLAIEYGRWNIRINAVSPGPVETPGLQQVIESYDANWSAWKEGVCGMQCLPTFLQPEDIANAILFLCSDEARLITGTNLVVDGGLLARSGDRM